MNKKLLLTLALLTGTAGLSASQPVIHGIKTALTATAGAGLAYLCSDAITKNAPTASLTSGITTPISALAKTTTDLLKESAILVADVTSRNYHLIAGACLLGVAGALVENILHDQRVRARQNRWRQNLHAPLGASIDEGYDGQFDENNPPAA